MTRRNLWMSLVAAVGAAIGPLKAAPRNKTSRLSLLNQTGVRRPLMIRKTLGNQRTPEIETRSLPAHASIIWDATNYRNGSMSIEFLDDASRLHFVLDGDGYWRKVSWYREPQDVVWTSRVYGGGQ